MFAVESSQNTHSLCYIVKSLFCSGSLNSKMLTEWYKYRAHEIERCSGQVRQDLDCWLRYIYLKNELFLSRGSVLFLMGRGFDF